MLLLSNGNVLPFSIKLNVDFVLICFIKLNRENLKSLEEDWTWFGTPIWKEIMRSGLQWCHQCPQSPPTPPGGSWVRTQPAIRTDPDPEGYIQNLELISFIHTCNNKTLPYLQLSPGIYVISSYSYFSGFLK